MHTIILHQPRNDFLAAQLIALYETLKGVSPHEQVVFDLSSLTWACPLLILPLSAYITTTRSKAVVNDCKIKSYLETIRFPHGVDSVDDFERQVQIQRNYTPISVLRREVGAGRERLESMFQSMVYKLLDTSLEGSRSAVYYPIGELVTNIFEHSKQDVGFIFAQHYPKKDYLDICIVDSGRGLRAGYKEEKELELTDEEAISEAMKGRSVKTDKGRGYGIWTSQRIVCDGLGGSFTIISGSAALLSLRGKDRLIKLPNFYWQGVIIAYRIPKPHEPFDLSRYVE